MIRLAVKLVNEIMDLAANALCLVNLYQIHKIGQNAHRCDRKRTIQLNKLRVCFGQGQTFNESNNCGNSKKVIIYLAFRFIDLGKFNYN